MRYRGKIGIILAAVGFGLLLSGCIAGGILGKTYVPWLSNFVDRETAYRVCMQEETNATVLVDIVDRWYALDDIRVLIFMNTNFPAKVRTEIIARGDAPDFYFLNAVGRKNVCTSDDLWAGLGVVNPYAPSLDDGDIHHFLRARNMPPEFYERAWRLYKYKRERAPLYGYLFRYQLESSMIRALSDELQEFMENPDIPATVLYEITQQLERLRDERGVMKGGVER